MRISTCGAVSAATFSWSLKDTTFWTLVVKTRYRLIDGGVMDRLSPLPIVESTARDEPRATRAAIELAPHRTSVDIVLSGRIAADATSVRLALLPRPPAASPEPLFDKTVSASDGIDCFGAMSPADPRRASLIDEVPAAWPPTVVDDIDWRYFNCAPEDQRIARLGGNEWIVIEGLRSRPAMACRFGEDLPCVELVGIAAESCSLPLRADAVVIDGDEMTCEVNWRGSFRLPPECSPSAVHATIVLEDEAATATLGDAFAGMHTVLLSDGMSLTTLEDWLERTEERLEPQKSASPAKEPPLPFRPGRFDAPIDIAPQQPASSGTVSLSESFEPTTVLPFEATPRVAQPGVTSARRPPDLRGPARQSTRAGDDETIAPAQHIEPNTSAGVALVNATRLPADVISCERDCLSLIAKATCRIAPGDKSVLADEQQPLAGERAVEDEWGNRVVAPDDLVPFKPSADVMVVGEAYAPTIETRVMRVGLGVAGERVSLQRDILVFGDRSWRRDVAGYAASEPAAFTWLPLSWHMAFGGRGFADNPLGMGLPNKLRPNEMPPLPRLEDPRQRLRTPKQRVAPACFAPLPQLWKRRPSTQLCDEIDWGRHQAAPLEQRCAWLNGDERFVLSGMNRQHATLEGSLPGLRIRAFVKWAGKPERHAPAYFTKWDGFEESAMALDTVLFEPSNLRVTLTWRGLLPVPSLAAPHVERVFVLDEPLDAPPQTLETIQRQLIR